MPNADTFCNTPWYELHVYWDGSLGICCQESRKLYTTGNYNIASTTIAEWFNSAPVQQFRKNILSGQPVSVCSVCYNQEQQGGISRRIRSNQKSAIFTQAFELSWQQSPSRRHFDPSGATTSHPIDIHIDLGNYCNLACKMCKASASSRIASQETRWGIKGSEQYLGVDWTKNTKVWHSFKQQLLLIPGLTNIHLMGGETLLTDKFEDLVDWMLTHNRTDIGFSFVTNGTVYNQDLVDKLSQFRRVGIEVSIETVDGHNGYVRQGTDTEKVLKHIEQYQQYISERVSVTLRPAISALSIGYYSGLLQYALDQQLCVNALLVNSPKFLNVNILPQSVKDMYAAKFGDLEHQLSSVLVDKDFNASNSNNYKLVIKNQINMCLNLLSQPQPDNVFQLHRDLVNHCRRWDQVYDFDARALYPELSEIWLEHEY